MKVRSGEMVKKATLLRKASLPLTPEKLTRRGKCRKWVTEW